MSLRMMARRVGSHLKFLGTYQYCDIHDMTLSSLSSLHHLLLGLFARVPMSVQNFASEMADNLAKALRFELHSFLSSYGLVGVEMQ